MWCGLHGLDADLPWIVVGQTGAAARDHTPHRHCFGSSHHLTQTIRYAGWEVKIWAQYLENTMLVLYWAALIYMHVISPSFCSSSKKDAWLLSRPGNYLVDKPRC